MNTPEENRLMLARIKNNIHVAPFFALIYFENGKFLYEDRPYQSIPERTEILEWVYCDEVFDTEK